MNNLSQDITKKYSESFFGSTIKYELKSSLDVAKIIISYFNPSSIIDIGCGSGIYLKAFNDLGIKDLLGYDGSENAIKTSLLPGKIKIYDLRKPLKLDQKFDLCICIEVAEHIENKYSEQLIETLTNLSDTIFFTAAPPGQGGTDHINEQPNSFWIDIFEKKGFRFINFLTNKIRKEMKENKVIFWIANNLMIFKKEATLD
jgi:2-polyprenyl-3-methyl-5-hydroxy-6-metoxy-1,4-benzoquinol methylase